MIAESPSFSYGECVKLYEDAARTVPLNLADYLAKGQYKKSAKSTKTQEIIVEV